MKKSQCASKKDLSDMKKKIIKEDRKEDNRLYVKKKSKRVKPKSWR